MNTADKLAEALRRCEQVIREACEEDPGKWDWAAINADEGAQAREALAAHEQAQAERVGLTDEQIAEGRYRTWAAEPEDAPEAWSFLRGARWAESALAVRWGVKLGATTGEQR